MERIYVTLRPKPLSLEDTKTSPWRISGNSISISNQSTKFEFDRIFGEECKTTEVYEARTKDIVSAAVRGFNGTVFAYGQTNSGKTHTMRGSASEPGVIPLAVRDLFRILQEDVDREFLLRMSYMEIYNEEINDLLAPEHRKLQVHESLERGIFVAGLREEIVASPEQVLDLMEFGESHRHFGETNMNVYSSRSHTIFRMIIESRDRTEDGEVGISCDAVRVSVLSLVDLAGSERAAKTGAEGMRLKEGSHINKSLMTLGTVIKKLSEGAESQGGHVPYRDSKLTRILQPSLGGNANTAIICNITLAQIHADETKSSLQFASRALRVTNCARVNEILTDAALLKRQKKEIEELRAKLQGSHSEHFEEEILQLRNTLLKSELERERMALELQEEKKAQALRERTLQEQAKKIENLSSMVLNSNMDEKRLTYKKDKRRDTWAPGALSRENIKGEVPATIQSKDSFEEPIRPERDMGLPVPFEKLGSKDEVGSIDIPQSTCVLDKNANSDLPGDCIVPDANALLHVTNRRKPPVKKNSSLVVCIILLHFICLYIKTSRSQNLFLHQGSNELVEMQADYEDLLVEFETQRTTKDIHIQCLTKKLAEADCHSDGKNFPTFTYQPSGGTFHGDTTLTLRDSEALLLIEQLQEQIKMLEMEKSSIQQNFDNFVESAMEQKIADRVTYDEVIMEENGNSMMELSTEAGALVLEFQSSRCAVESICSVVDELFQNLSVISCMFLDLKSFMCLNSAQLKSVIGDHEKMHSCMRKKVSELESDKSVLYNQSIDLHNQIQQLRLDLQQSERVLMDRCEQQELEKAEFLSQIQNLEKEVSCLSSCSLAREKESLRKELEKTKLKLKETESKLKNVIQDKTKLEGEKAQAEREIKHLHSQKNLLERDISRRDSVIDRRRDSLADQRHKITSVSKPIVTILLSKGEYKKLEVLAFEMETTIASLDEELAATNAEKEEALIRSDILASELEAMSLRLSTADTEIQVLQEEVSSMSIKLADSESSCNKMERSISLLLEEKEELAMQLSNVLLELEEEKAIWSAKEKASIEAIADRAKSSDAELMLLSKEMLEVRHELESFRDECKVLKERLTLSEENAEWERKCRMEKSAEIDQLRLKISEIESEKCQDVRAMLTKARVDMEELTRKLSDMDIKIHKDTVSNINEKAKLRMRLRGSQAMLDAHRGRHKESLDEIVFMNKKFEEASTKLKERLATQGVEVLHLKKQLVEMRGNTCQ
ncbi:Kinesin [Macleaya cordata]|uniref:Kinesin n=1 Tax=Macleaya cordata TaxID=56857 RepID=A0A200R729_MACCD|nr:Kinesin [Macleaya cordata]